MSQNAIDFSNTIDFSIERMSTQVLSILKSLAHSYKSWNYWKIPHLLGVIDIFFQSVFTFGYMLRLPPFISSLVCITSLGVCFSF